MSEPELEERYIVLKLSRMNDEQVKQVNKIAGNARVDSVVVEEDWPEYEPTVDSILDRVAKQQDDRIKELEDALDGLLRDKQEPLDKETSNWFWNRARAVLSKQQDEVGA